MRNISKYSASLNKVCLLVLVFLFSCKDFVEIDPPKNEISNPSVYSSDGTVISAISGLYSEMISGNGFASGGYTSITTLTGKSSDEFINYSNSSDDITFYTNSLLPKNEAINASLWSAAYKYIYYANSIIEGLAVSTGVTSATKIQIEGEAKFIRAFCHFYLVNLFGDVPIVTTTDYNTNNIIPRHSKEQVYQQIIADLKDAQALLSDIYVSGIQRVRPNRSAANALLARAYLYMQDWVNAEVQATMVIDNTTLYSLVNLNDVFKKNSSEAIWQLRPTIPGLNTNEGSIFILTSTPEWVSLTNEMFNAFEPGDDRKTNWTQSIDVNGITYHYPFKYKIQVDLIVNEYSMVLRLAEQYLIRAEARAQQNNITGAQEDINIIRNRAGLSNITEDTKPALLLAIEQERRVEFFTEWGHRWLDLKRWNRADAVLGSLKTPNWQQTDVLYPIPQVQINNDPNIEQNPGY